MYADGSRACRELGLFPWVVAQANDPIRGKCSRY